MKSIGVEAQLNIAGEGNLKAELQRIAENLGVSEFVNFMGRVAADRMGEVYRDNDIFVMSSEHEGMSNAMLEAMASGLPIITTRCEGVEELISDNGIVVEEPDVKSIADAIGKLTTGFDYALKRSVDNRRRSAGLRNERVFSH